MRIENYNKIYNLRNVLIITGILHLLAAFLISYYDATISFPIAFGCTFLLDFIFLLILYPIAELLKVYIRQQTIRYDRQNNIPEYRYDYGDFNGTYWTIVKRHKRYSIHEDWETQYNLINRDGELFFPLFCKEIQKITVPEDLIGFHVRYDQEYCNVILCNGYMYKNITFLVDEQLRQVSHFDSEGIARVTFADNSVNYVNTKGEKLYKQNLIGQVKSPNFE
jgi:hypothetical protein